MVDSNTGKQRLELFDDLSLNNKEERRLQVLALWDFYSEIICMVGTTYLDQSADLKDKNLRKQWNRVRNRLNALSSFSSIGDYEEAIKDLHGIRNDTFHDFEHWPQKDRLLEIREFAEEFRNWLIENGEEYADTIDELDTRETMIRMTERNIDETLDLRVPHEEPFRSEVQNQKKRAKELKQRLDSLGDRDEVTMELVNLLMSSMECQQETTEANEAGEYIGWVLGEIAEPEVSPEEFGL
ncbi:hypothetical protein [Halobaculum sp. D14]|uniref:hypothetical protein n=1 Tax=Halobaculum sp. D14 TaxID=3421642 RepID=UPI003EBB25DC